MRGARTPEAAAAALELYRDSPDDLAVLGVIDLVVAHPDRVQLTAFWDRLLGQTTSLDLYRYAATAAVAARSDDLVQVLRGRIAAESDERRKAVLSDALTLA